VDRNGVLFDPGGVPPRGEHDGNLAPEPTKIEKIVTASQAADAEEMEKLEKAGITPVVVPDGDRDHQGTVYDDADEQKELEGV
jgi:hypothetical protein